MFGHARAWRGLASGCALIALLTFLAYLPALRAGFVWDDDSMLTENQTIKSPDGLAQIWASTVLPDYFPLTSTSLWLEWRLWRMKAAGYHATNLLVHCCSALVLWRVLRNLSVPIPWLAAALFAVHPVNVESVAWIAERKNTLAMLFYVLTLYAWLRATTAGSLAADGRAIVEQDSVGKLGARWYAMSVVFFLLSLLSKTAAVTLPFVLLLIQWWRTDRVRIRDVILTLPFFALSLGLGLVTVWFQYHRAIGSDPVPNAGFVIRCLTAARAVWFYLAKAVVPLNLSFVYPRWDISAGSPVAWVPALALIGCGVMFWRGLKSKAAFIRGWTRSAAFAGAYYLLMLAPILGLLNIYFFRFSQVADHYQYFAIPAVTSLFATVVFWIGKGGPITGRSAGGLLLASLALVTFRQCSSYEDAETLWRDTLTHNTNSFLAANNLGEILLRKGSVDEAVSIFRTALKARPDSTEALNNLGNALLREGQVQDAIALYEKAVETNTNSPDPHFNLATALLQQGKLESAAVEFQSAIKLRPNHGQAHYNLANVLVRQGRLDDALKEYETSLSIDSNSSEIENNYAAALLQTGRGQDALIHFQKALTVEPNNSGAHYNLANLLLQAGQVDEAIKHYEHALAGNPADAPGHFNLATALLLKGRLTEAIQHYETGLRLKPEEAGARNNLGSALLQSGRGQEAVRQFEAAVKIDPNSPKAHLNLGLALLQINDKTGACGEFEKTLRIDPGFTLPPVAQETLHNCRGESTGR